MAQSWWQRLLGQTKTPPQDGDLIDIDWSDLPAPPSAPAALSPQQQVEQQFGIQLHPPGRNERYVFGVVRQVSRRQESETHWPTIFTQQPIQRQWQVLTFVVEVRDAGGNIVELAPVEARGLRMSGDNLSDGTPVAVCGRRGNDGIINTYKIINLHTRSSLTVELPRGYRP